jgi:hypothetical protein
MLRILFITILFTIGFHGQGRAEVWNDSTNADSDKYPHNRSRAALLSALLPGSGQIYNEIGYRKHAGKKHRAWWKVPIIYGGLGACGYYFYQNNKMANLTRQEWLERDANEDLVFYDERFNGYSKNQLIDGNGGDFPGYDNFARRRDIFIFAFVGVWGLNVLESYVDAHFVTFDVSEDLSFSTSPTLLGLRHPGLSLQLHFN